MLKAGIVGGSGFVAGELIRCLLHHPEVHIDFIYSHSNAGEKIHRIHHDLFERKELEFTNRVNLSADVVFLCLGHGNSAKFLKDHNFSPHTKIIDLSNDFRLEKNTVFRNRKFIYGLSELKKHEITQAQNIANPGCFATAIQLALLPLVKYSPALGELHIQAVTGSTGAGQSLTPTTSHNWRNNNISVYKAFTHEHLNEIKETIYGIGKNDPIEINFIPYRGDYTRGIFSTVYTNSDFTENELLAMYEAYYKDAMFTHITKDDINLKQVVNTNHCLIQVQKIGGKVLIHSVIDNLLKGSAGQAIQNMNLMCGINESLGLKLKANCF